MVLSPLSDPTMPRMVRSRARWAWGRSGVCVAACCFAMSVSPCPSRQAPRPRAMGTRALGPLSPKLLRIHRPPFAAVAVHLGAGLQLPGGALAAAGLAGPDLLLHSV